MNLSLALIMVLVSTAPQDSDTAAPAVDAPDGAQLIELSLEQAIAECINNNLALQRSGLSTEASVAGLGAAWGDFDTEFFTTVTRSETVQAPKPINFSGGVNLGPSNTSEFDFLSVRSGVRGKFETGMTWELSASTTEVRNTNRRVPQETFPGSGVFVTKDLDNDETTAEWSLSLTQPLLRGGSKDYARSELELAAKDVSIAAIATRSLTYTTIVSVVTAYWELVYSRQNVDTVNLSLELAGELLAITERKYQQGIQNRIDVIEVEADVARRLEELLTAENAVKQAVDNLQQLVFAPESDDEWSREIIPSTAYAPPPEGSRVDTQAAVRDALMLRPDIANARLDLERAAIEVRRAESESQSRLDITGSYGLNSNETNSGLALRRLNDTGLHEASIFIDYEVPFGNRRAGYNLRRRKIERERASVALREAEIIAVSGVRSSARDVGLQTERIKATAETTRLRLEVYEGEKRRLENDLSTPFEVREAQRDYLTAVDEGTRARLDLAIAQTNLLSSRGRLLEHYGIVPPMPDVSLDDAPDAP